MVYIGIDLGGTGIKIGVVDESGAILSQGETPTLAGRPYEDIIADMGRCMLDVMARGGFEEKDIASIGVGIPGVADEKTGHVIFCTNLGWSDVPLRTELQKYLNKPVYIDNDATVAGFAESICGVSAGCHSSVFMTLGTGVGGGIVINGKPYSGVHGIGSEIGHMIIKMDGEPCTCGNLGCMEAYCAASALTRDGRRAMQAHPESMLAEQTGGDPGKITPKLVTDCAKAGDAAAKAVFDTYIEHLSSACASVYNILDPEVLAIGGGLSAAGPFLFDPLQEKVSKKCFYATRGKLVPAVLGNEAGMVGAALLARDAKV